MAIMCYLSSIFHKRIVVDVDGEEEENWLKIFQFYRVIIFQRKISYLSGKMSMEFFFFSL